MLIPKKLTDTINYLDRLDFDKLIDQGLEQLTPLMEQLNREQWRAGIRSDGSKITPSPYSVQYARRKKRLGRLTNGNSGIINLNLNGGLYAGLKYVLDKNQVEIIQENITPFYHMQTYGEKIVGLTESNINRINEKLKVLVTNEIRENI